MIKIKIECDSCRKIGGIYVGCNPQRGKKMKDILYTQGWSFRENSTVLCGHCFKKKPRNKK